MMEKAKKKSRAHTRYMNKAGIRVPGVTTITGTEAKPALVKWANKLGIEGIDSSKYVDELAKIGTLAHYMAECFITEKDPDFKDYSPDQIAVAETCMIKFYDWIEKHDFGLIGSELQLVSEKHQYGGTCDIYCKLDGIYTLIDLKTSKGLFPEHGTQVCAYAELLKENGMIVDEIKILRIGRSETEGFEIKEIFNRELQIEKFLALKRVYDINKILRKK